MIAPEARSTFITYLILITVVDILLKPDAFVKMIIDHKIGSLAAGADPAAALALFTKPVDENARKW